MRCCAAIAMAAGALMAAGAAMACGRDATAPTPIRFLHTFGPGETELFNTTMVERGIAVESSRVPFARGQQVMAEILRARTGCPDLVRIDATWLAGLVAAGLLVAPPPPLTALDWLPEAAETAQLDGRWWAIPQTVDGLIVVRDAGSPAPASPSLEDLIGAARAARTATRRYPLGLRADGYWLVPWLRAEHSDLAVATEAGHSEGAGLCRLCEWGEPDHQPTPHGINGPGATRALTAYAALFGELVAPPPPAGSEAPDELRRWSSRELAYWVTGPWMLGALRDRERIAVSPLAHAPRGGQLLVVPVCAKHPGDGWRLASELAAIPVEVRFAEAFTTVPTRRAALAAAPALAREVYEALRGAEMLPREPVTPLLFDDLNPALAAVIAGDATAREAIEGVRHGWRRLLARGAQR